MHCMQPSAAREMAREGERERERERERCHKERSRADMTVALFTMHTNLTLIFRVLKYSIYALVHVNVISHLQYPA